MQLLLGFVALGVIFFLAYNFSPQKKFFFFQNKQATLQAGNLTINELIQKDSDGDGVPDWEEALWGTDKNNKETFGIPDLTYIANKKKALGISPSANTNQNQNETEKFAQDFFTAYAAMKTSGQVDDTAISNFSNALGQQITNASVVDQYSEKDIEIAKSDEKKDQESYYVTAGTLFEKYKAEGVGSELEAAGEVAAGGDAGDTQGQNNLVKISGAYQEFAQKLLLVPVPHSLAEYHLKIINSANNTGIAVLNMSKMMTDPVVGISGISQYEKYSDDLINSVHDLETFLSTNGIIPSSDATPGVSASDNSTIPSNDTSVDTSNSSVPLDNNTNPNDNPTP